MTGGSKRESLHLDSVLYITFVLYMGLSSFLQGRIKGSWSENSTAQGLVQVQEATNEDNVCMLEKTYTEVYLQDLENTLIHFLGES